MCFGSRYCAQSPVRIRVFPRRPEKIQRSQTISLRGSPTRIQTKTEKEMARGRRDGRLQVCVILKSFGETSQIMGKSHGNCECTGPEQDRLRPRLHPEEPRGEPEGCRGGMARRGT